MRSFVGEGSGTVRDAYEGVVRGVTGPFDRLVGTPVWEREWDVLVVLDACRHDVFAEEYGDAPWLSPVERVASVGSRSPEWIARTFDERYAETLADTVYVSGNPFSATHGATDALRALDEPWRYAWDGDAGTIPPDPVSDRAVDLYRRHAPDRLVVHYMQPHWPYVDGERYGFNPAPERDTAAVRAEYGGIPDDQFYETEFDLQRRGELSRATHLRMYRENLRWAVDRIRATLLRGIDADRVAITADHGELFGEWGLYEHPGGVVLPALRRVPWATTDASRAGYEPTTDAPDGRVDADVEARLSSLGYR